MGTYALVKFKVNALVRREVLGLGEDGELFPNDCCAKVIVVAECERRVWGQSVGAEECGGRVWGRVWGERSVGAECWGTVIKCPTKCPTK